jgi:hypothetical protein
MQEIEHLLQESVFSVLFRMTMLGFILDRFTLWCFLN